MKIAICAFFTSGKVEEGGSSRFMRCLGNELSKFNEVSYFNYPQEPDDNFDFVFCSHYLPKTKSKTIFYSHGIVEEEQMRKADICLSGSQEVKDFWLNKLGIDSTVLPQPINKGIFLPPKKLENILIIRRYPVGFEPFAYLFNHYTVSVSRFDIPIEEQIKKVDLVISVGRGALESMSYGKPVLVAGARYYMGAIGDGYLDKDKIQRSSLFNFSGRAFKLPITNEFLVEEIKKFNPNDSKLVFDFSLEYTVDNFVKKLISFI